MRQSIIYLVRHGQTEWNAERRLQGRIDVPLNETGLAQAEMVAGEFAGHQLDAIYSSPLVRAMHTARIINTPHGHEIQTHEALTEASYGPLEGIKIDDYHRQCSEHIAYFFQMSLQERVHFKIAPEAESYFEVYERVYPVLQQLSNKHQGQKILVVTHGGLMRAVFSMMAGVDVREIKIENGGYMVLAGDGAAISIQEHKRIAIERKA
jgi:2,3-bisphosphoglycerate-dependent phosphoglycerate mutase